MVVSFKPGDERKLELDYATLAALNPRLIYGQISAYGPGDPRPGFDAILQAEAGVASLANQATNFLVGGVVPRRISRSGLARPRFPTASSTTWPRCLPSRARNGC